MLDICGNLFRLILAAIPTGVRWSGEIRQSHSESFATLETMREREFNGLEGRQVMVSDADGDQEQV